MNVAADLGTLNAALGQAGWNPRRLAVEVNRWLIAHGQPERRVHQTAPYAWVRQDSVPRTPLPEAVAVVVSEALGTIVTPAQLWPGRGLDHHTTMVGAAEQEGTRTVDDVIASLHELVASAGGTVRRVVAAATARDVVDAVTAMTAAVASRPTVVGPADPCRTPLGDVLGAHVGRLSCLEDQYGGGRLVRRYVAGELSTVLALIRSGSREPLTRREALIAAADLARLAGWSEFHADRLGLAQRYLLLSLRLCLTLGIAARTADILGMLAYLAAVYGHGAEAITLATRALHEGRYGGPVLRARLLARAASAAAAAGDEATFHRASDQARNLLSGHADTEQPAGLYGFGIQQAEAEIGHGLLLLSRVTATGTRRLLREAVRVLTPVCDLTARANHPRSVMLHAAYLAQAQLAVGNLPEAVEAARIVLRCLSRVQSVRCRRELLLLRDAFGRHARTEPVAAFLPELHAVLHDVDTTLSRRRAVARAARARPAAGDPASACLVFPVAGGGRC